MDWDAVVLLPFLEDRKLECILTKVQSQLTNNDLDRPKNGHSLIFTSNKGTSRHISFSSLYG